ncbi:hypothetical protein BCR34DRAFT_595955 [Clohesyomyces aquaticus]|uniref:RBR-type E3 ubiquitin transferase n=1 Tax=Clohesyomyces aquaticus TaxID=1231657 RepID=A0A1Y2A875_9PLEO|nr:hypothetical protein BCR34DRAFT_595955 [Clohesyomyces aquaticus]
MPGTEKTCVICGDEEEAEGEAQLIQSPCERHWLCESCLEETFRLAMKDEKHYPPQCCDAIFLIDEFEDALDFNLAWDYRVKERGEYSVQPRFRVYCANSACDSHPFLHPDSYIQESIRYAVCDACSIPTCVGCKTLVQGEVGVHECEVTEAEKKFHETVKEKGWKECYSCGKWVELAEACNHMMCPCGASFCYVCGKPWEGPHSCPQYGPARYDEEGYNQDGFHKDTGLNRDGQTRREQRMADGEDREDDLDEDDIDPEEEEWVPPDMRDILAQLPEDEREEALMQLQLHMIERREQELRAANEDADNADWEVTDEADGQGDDAESSDVGGRSDSSEREHEDNDAEENAEADTEDDAGNEGDAFETAYAPANQGLDSDSDDTVTAYHSPTPYPDSSDYEDNFDSDQAARSPSQTPIYSGDMPGAFPPSDDFSESDLVYDPSRDGLISEQIHPSHNDTGHGTPYHYSAR